MAADDRPQLSLYADDQSAKLKKLGNMCRKVGISTARQFKACDQLRDKMHVSTTARLICCKAQLVQQLRNQPSKAGMLLYMYWQHAERQAGLPCEGYLWRYDSDRNCQVLKHGQTSLLSVPRKGCQMTPRNSNMLAEGSRTSLTPQSSSDCKRSDPGVSRTSPHLNCLPH